MLARPPLTAEVIIQRERNLQQEGVLSHFYECFIVLQLKLDLVVMSPRSKTICNRWNMKGWVKCCCVTSQVRPCLLPKRRRGLRFFPQHQELPRHLPFTSKVLFFLSDCCWCAYLKITSCTAHFCGKHLFSSRPYQMVANSTYPTSLFFI